MMAYGYPEHWIRELGHRIKRVHFKDFSRGSHRFVNLLDGDTDWASVMEAFRAVGYDGYVVHEVGGDRKHKLILRNGCENYSDVEVKKERRWLDKTIA